MPLTLLLDLDDTLLNTNMAEFVPAYFQALAAHLSPWVKPEVMLPALISSTQLMLANEDPSLTVQQVFERDFYPRLGVEKEQLQDALDDFYETSFRLLRSVTGRRPGARELVEWAIDEGHRVAIATDPLFPSKAIEERIRWAGLEPERFELISSYETFHFTKSRTAYYAELLGRLGWPDGPVLMVGNDETRDLACAQALGLATYQVETPAGIGGRSSDGGQAAQPWGRGSLTDLLQWLQSTDIMMLEPAFHGRPAILGILASTPAVLQEMVSGLSVEAMRHEPAADEWALIEIICHLRDTEREVHQTQIKRLREEVQPFVPRPDAAVWAKQRNYLDEDGLQAISDFTSARMQILRELHTLDPEIWERRARHAIFGPTSFQEVVGFMADHDRLHTQQAWQTRKVAV